MSSPPDPARSRFAAIALLRLTGALMAAAGLVISAGKVVAPAGFGFALIAVGVLDMLLVPLWLQRRWRTPRP